MKQYFLHVVFVKKFSWTRRIIVIVCLGYWEYWVVCVSKWFQSQFFFSGLQHSRDRTFPTVWPSMLSCPYTASSPQFGRAEYPQICVLHCEVGSVCISFSLLQCLATKFNFLLQISVGDIRICEVLTFFMLLDPRERPLQGLKQILSSFGSD